MESALENNTSKEMREAGLRRVGIRTAILVYQEPHLIPRGALGLGWPFRVGLN